MLPWILGFVRNLSFTNFLWSRELATLLTLIILGMTLSNRMIRIGMGSSFIPPRSFFDLFISC